MNQAPDPHTARRELGEMEARNRDRAPRGSTEDVFGGASGSGSTTFVDGGGNDPCARNAKNDHSNN